MSNKNMKEITYSLKLNNTDSEQYYSDVKFFADKVLAKSGESISSIVGDYVAYIKEYNLEEPRLEEEYVLELLSFGILWHTYAQTALNVKRAPFITLAKMGEWRKKYQRLKPIIDLSRGLLTTLFLLPENKQKEFIPAPSLENIDRVCRWFEATGEFREQAIRFVRWRAYWAILTTQKLHEIFLAIADFRNWFEVNSLEAVGKYTEEVESFLHESENKYRWREDRISCSRSRLEYHLNMVGAELMNRAFRKEFLETDATAVLLPGCMRSRLQDECEAIKEPKGLRCIGCDSKCRVNYLREIGVNKNFVVYVIPHASDLSLWAPKVGSVRQGVVASACLTTLVEGGWELKRYGVPAQCVLLDYSGCKKHWHREGIATALNRNELLRIIERAGRN